MGIKMELNGIKIELNGDYNNTKFGLEYKCSWKGVKWILWEV